MDELINIPIPDRSGAQETQTVQQNGVMPMQPESPMSMARVASGLAAESHSGLNRQSTQLMIASWGEERNKREEAEAEVKRLLPENAVLIERVNNLRREEKKGAFINLIGLTLFTIGTTIILSDAGAKDSNIYTMGWLILGAAAVLILIDIFSSLWGKN